MAGVSVSIPRFFSRWALIVLPFLFASCPVRTEAQLDRELDQQYTRYQETTIRNRRFKHAQLEAIVKKLGPPFRVEKAGESIEGRSIYKVTAGSGPVKVLLWSQMHGDESTATMAIFDIFRFLSADDQFNGLRRQLLRDLTMVFIPMLNPDGAEAFTRRNALGIDINRDAMRLQTPEAQLLKRVRDELQADWGFNLHDQSRYYAAGMNPNTATLSFLAPAYNYAKDINESRGRAMRLIGLMNQMLQGYIPGKVARYNDDFEPRAFGDNIQKWGTSTILIESGGLDGDPEKQQIRKLNFLALLTAMEGIAGRRYADIPLNAYEKIPFNESGAFHDLILREVEVEKNGRWYTVDIGIRRGEVSFDGARKYYVNSSIEDLGDLSVFYGYEEFAGKGYRVTPGKVYPTVVPNWAAFQKLDHKELWRQGYTAVRIAEWPGEKARQPLPLQPLKKGQSPGTEILPGRNPGLLFKKDGKLRYALVNGMLYPL